MTPSDASSLPARPYADAAARLAMRFWSCARQALLTRDRRQQVRLAQAGLANLLMLACVAVVHVIEQAGAADADLVRPWMIGSVSGMVLFFVVIRSGRVKHWRDPSLTMLQMLYAILCSAIGYGITGPLRGVVIPILAVVLMFGMFGMTRTQVRIVGAYTLLAFGAGSAWWLTRPGLEEPVAAEAARLMMVAIVVAGVMVLTGRLHDMRQRSRSQRAALARALERIHEMATRDDLTGCFNRRAMRERLAEESHPSVRQRTALCVALIDLDHFKQVNDRHGHAAGDCVLRSFADLARAKLRAGDMLARWGGEEFLLLLPATDLAQAQACVQRVLDAMSSRAFDDIAPGLVVTGSAGLAECGPGESVDAAIERADGALYRAKGTGRNRLVCA